MVRALKNSRKLIRALVKVAGNSLSYEAESVRVNFRKAVTKNLHKTLVQDTEKKVVQELTPWVEEQVNDIRRGLWKAIGDDAEKIMNNVFDAADYYDSLIDTLLPILAEGMSRSALGYFATLGVDLKQVGYQRKETIPIGSASRASQWLASSGTELPPGILTDIPAWMQAALAEQVKEAFSQDYWEEIAGTTKNDVEVFVRNGLVEGQSIRQMANKINEKFPIEYSRKRAVRIARTESGNALNGARKASFDKLQEDLGSEVPMQEEWLSVLSNATRDSHANLDAVTANKDGLWSLGGVMVPWPSHFSLPAGERVNCMCTTVTTFGIPEGQAIDRIQEHANVLVADQEPATVEPATLEPSTHEPKYELDTNDEVDKVLKEVYGISSDEVGKLIGAPDGATISIGNWSNTVSVRVEGENERLGRYVMSREFIEENGKKICVNEVFTTDKTGTGFGTEAFYNQTRNLQAKGFSHIETNAVRDDDEGYVGYTVWPKLGYDTGPDFDIEDVTGEDAPDGYNGKLSDLMKTQDGRDWWKEYGADVGLSFDLSTGSQSMEVLTAYAENKGIK